MGIAYRLGYVAMVIWLFYVLYAIQHVDAWNDDGRAAIGIFIGFVGLIVFPVYFVLVYLFGKVVRAGKHR
ncbi:hypothetical protein SAMN03159341_10342 [Paenibacillus sp. 1_12]|nr:hypothetical protein SAMN03159341_10342 [Paenibacillus sp. 1_12]